MTKSILFVDDERNILKALNRLFLDDDYYIFTADNGKEALDILEKKRIDLIVTDMKMPLMDGYELLKEVQHKYPDTLKLILSGYAEKNMIFQCIEENLAMFYLLKPWHNQKLIHLIEKLFSLKEILTEKKLIEIYPKFLPVAKNTYEILCRKIHENADMNEIEQIIAQDPITVIKILHFVHSAFEVRTGSLKKALCYLSLSDLKEIVLTDKFLEDMEMSDSIFVNREMLSNHASFTHQIVHFIYNKLLHKKIPEDYEMAGLLCNVGIAIMLGIFSEPYIQLMNCAYKRKNDVIIEMEEERMGINHQEIGGYLLNWWGFPCPIVESASFHHNPLNEKVIHKELVCAVHIAVHYAWKFLGWCDKVSEEAFHVLGVTKRCCDQLMEEVNIGLRDSCQ